MWTILELTNKFIESYYFKVNIAQFGFQDNNQQLHHWYRNQVLQKQQYQLHQVLLLL